ncbi:MAG: hypothetical protein ACYTEQ_29210 [Planctomycetota bacterium]|jgi:hypothetical protein
METITKQTTRYVVCGESGRWVTLPATSPYEAIKKASQSTVGKDLGDTIVYVFPVEADATE